MPRAKSNVRKHDRDAESDSQVDPADFFNAPRDLASPKSKLDKAPATPTDMDVDEKKAAAKPAGSSGEIGFPASELADVAPKKFNFAQHAMGKSSGGAAPLSSMPDGAPGCLEGLKFVVTGEFSGMSREQITDLIKTFGGQVTSAVSGKTSYLVVGDEPGSGKVKKAKAMKTRCLYEHHLIELIESSKDGSNADDGPGEPNSAAEVVMDDDDDVVEEVPTKAVERIALTEAKPVAEKRKAQGMEPELKPAKKAEKETQVKTEPSTRSKADTAASSTAKTKPASARPSSEEGERASKAPAQSELWTDKYKPTKLKDLCGHKTMAQEILKWLGWWASGTVPEKRAVLISGPPGIGKTTTAHLVAKLAGFDVLELNASETRSKSALSGILGAAVGNRSVLEFDRRSLRKLEEQKDQEDADAPASTNAVGGKKLVVIMDEVDGMSGGDRGGSTELIQLIKRTRVPIICICNDRMSPKVRTLANYCEDMRFRRPTEQQMRARLNTIAFREGLRLEPNAIAQLVQSTHNDIRQVINLMSSYALSRGTMSYLESKEYTNLNRKEVAIGPFDVIGKYMNGVENSSMTFADKLDLYYNDFSITPLFVQENYIDNHPGAARNAAEVLERLSSAADMISEADTVDNKLRGSQQWGLMPLHAALSCVGPAFYVRGRHDGMYRFPGWLGQNSKAGKLSRYLRDVQSHMRLRISADKTEVRQSYIPAMVSDLVMPLINQGVDGIPDVVSFMDHYYLSKDHWDAMLELHLDGERLLKRIPTAVKSAFTREYKKASHPVAFQPLAGVPSGRAVQAAASASLRPDTEDVVDDDVDGVVEEDEDEGESDSVENDALIAAAKPKGKAAKGKAAAPSAAKSRGSGDASASRPRKRQARGK
ncbi:DNA replication factor C complex subunit Rfc1 [Coemansia sp. Benny D115]|nr:DNA replication factor C complex subunit Rfc1 [Coemansia sp. Benny D115]